MQIYVDTAYALSLSIPTHDHHDRAQRWLKQHRSKALTFHASAHMIAEAYSTLTNPQFYPVTPQSLRQQILANIQSMIGLAPQELFDYTRAFALAEALDLRSGGIYDALHLACAERLGVEELWTFNERHFMRFQAMTQVRIVVPN